jgi:hypothetical protein
MAGDLNQPTSLPFTRVESIRRCAQHLRLWLAATGLPYNHVAREHFVRAHPVLFGSAYEVTLRGYDRWRTLRAASDSVDGFARYIARRHERWMTANGAAPGLAPCLIGLATTTQPCWTAAQRGASPQNDVRAA